MICPNTPRATISTMSPLTPQVHLLGNAGETKWSKEELSLCCPLPSYLISLNFSFSHKSYQDEMDWNTYTLKCPQGPMCIRHWITVNPLPFLFLSPLSTLCSPSLIIIHSAHLSLTCPCSWTASYYKGSWLWDLVYPLFRGGFVFFDVLSAGMRQVRGARGWQSKNNSQSIQIRVGG